MKGPKLDTQFGEDFFAAMRSWTIAVLDEEDVDQLRDFQQVLLYVLAGLAAGYAEHEQIARDMGAYIQLVTPQLRGEMMRIQEARQ